MNRRLPTGGMANGTFSASSTDPEEMSSLSLASATASLLLGGFSTFALSIPRPWRCTSVVSAPDCVAYTLANMQVTVSVLMATEKTVACATHKLGVQPGISDRSPGRERVVSWSRKTSGSSSLRTFCLGQLQIHVESHSAGADQALLGGELPRRAPS